MEVKLNHGKDCAELNGIIENSRKTLVQRAPPGICINDSAKIMWPVDDTGKNSVIPSTIPMITDLIKSNIG